MKRVAVFLQTQLCGPGHKVRLRFSKFYPDYDYYWLSSIQVSSKENGKKDLFLTLSHLN
jgi:hypothetical protein